jgi:hypothetical protein
MSPVLILAVALLLQDTGPAPTPADTPAAGATVPDAVPAAEVPAADLYQPPRIRPFEPPPDFAAPVDARAPAAGPRALDRTVTVETYAGDYEAADTATDLAYAAGVRAAESRVNAGMGPLDGLWRVVDREGRTRVLLAIVDPGGEAPVQGAWMIPGAPPAVDDGALGGEVRGPDEVRLATGAGTLRLTLRGGVWRGQLVGDDGATAVSLRRP